MEKEVLDFFSKGSIEVAVDLSREQDNFPCPTFDVTLKKGGVAETFSVLGSPEPGKWMTPADAVRALIIRMRLHENGVRLSPHSGIINGETSSRLKHLLGPGVYRELLDIDFLGYPC
jgi:hypothetical protein